MAGLLAGFSAHPHVGQTRDWPRGDAWVWGGGDGFEEHGVVVKHASEFVGFLGDTDFGSVKVSFPLFDKRQPCVLSNFILDIATRHHQVPCFQIRLPFSEYDHLTKVLDKEIGSQVNKAQKLWVAPLNGSVQRSKAKTSRFYRGTMVPPTMCPAIASCPGNGL